MPVASRQSHQQAKYQIVELLAVGGMAEIYRARALGIEGFEKNVVLKRIRKQYADDPKFVQMFLDEARLAARLHHQNVAQVYDIGMLNSAYFFTMEYLHGEDMRAIARHVARHRQRIPLQQALTMVAGAAAGLHYAHELRGPDGTSLDIVHRDISPSNIVVTFAGGVKVVDFGIARATQRDAETRTGEGIKGKLSYMSPEQCMGERVDRRSDLFSLGVVLYEMTTMRRLFRGSSADADYVVMQRIVSGDFAPPSSVDAGYPPQLEKIVLRALASNRDQRYSSARELLLDIEAFAARVQLPLSQASLSGYMEGLFGRRPEPWLTEGNGTDNDITSFEGPRPMAKAALLQLLPITPQPPALPSRSEATMPEVAEGTIALATRVGVGGNGDLPSAGVASTPAPGAERPEADTPGARGGSAHGMTQPREQATPDRSFATAQSRTAIGGRRRGARAIGLLLVTGLAAVATVVAVTGWPHNASSPTAPQQPPIAAPSAAPPPAVAPAAAPQTGEHSPSSSAPTQPSSEPAPPGAEPMQPPPQRTQPRQPRAAEEPSVAEPAVVGEPRKRASGKRASAKRARRTRHRPAMRSSSSDAKTTTKRTNGTKDTRDMKGLFDRDW